MTVALGLGGYIGIGEESTYGTTVARSLFELMNSESIKPNELKVESRSLYRVARDIRRRAQGRIEVGGDIMFDARYSSRFMTTMLKHLIGSVATTQPDVTTAPTAYRHTYTPTDALPTGLSIEVAKDQLAHLHSGCKVDSMSFRFAQGELLETSATIIGRETTSISKTPLSFTDGQLIVCNNASITWNGVTQNVNDGDIRIENVLARRLYMNGGRVTGEPHRNGKRRVSGSFTIDLEDAVLYSDFRNATERVMVITFTGDTIAGAYAYDLVMTANVAELQDGMAQADTEGPLIVRCAFETFINSGNTSELSVRVTNENSAA